MPTRFNSQSSSQVRLGIPPLQSGYQGKSTSRDLVIPPVGIDDVDRALFNLFDKEIPFTVVGGADDPDGLRKVPVLMTAGEKWALNKRQRGLKDRNGALILPIITIIRTNIFQTPNEDITGRGINQQTGEIVIRRKLDRTDRDYQQLVNRLLVPNQQNLAVNPQNAYPTSVSTIVPGEFGDDLFGADAPFGEETDVQNFTPQLTTLRSVGNLEQDPAIQQGGLLIPNRANNVWETVVVPAPQFFTAQYDVTFWTQYTKHMNQLIEMLIASFLPQGNQWQLNTPKGYWFLANVDANTYTADNNADDYSQVERLIKYKFVVKVPGYILATGVPGAPVPLKRYLSSPTIEFSIGTNTAELDEGDSSINPFLGADDPTLPLGSDSDQQPNWANRQRDQRNTRGTRLYPNEDVSVNPDDPAVGVLPRGTRPGRFKKVTGYDKNGNLVTKLFRVKSINKFTGETVLSPADATLGGLTIVTVED